MIALVPIVVALVGALVYGLAANPKAAELGRLAFFVGLFFSVWPWVSRSIELLR